MNIDLFLTYVIFRMAWIVVMEYVKSNDTFWHAAKNVQEIEFFW